MTTRPCEASCLGSGGAQVPLLWYHGVVSGQDLVDGLIVVVD